MTLFVRFELVAFAVYTVNFDLAGATFVVVFDWYFKLFCGCYYALKLFEADCYDPAIF